MEFKLDLPVSPMVFQYLISRFRKPSHVDTILLDTTTYEGKYFYGLLGRKQHDGRTITTKFSKKITIQVTENLWIRNSCILTKSTSVKFNSYISECIHGQLHLFVDAQLTSGKKIKTSDSIKKFLKKYNFTEESFAFETAKRSYYRYREDPNKSIFYKKEA